MAQLFKFPESCIFDFTGVVSNQDFWLPEHIVQFTEMVEEQSFVATFKSVQSDHSQTVHKVEIVDKKGVNINQKFGKMTNTLCSEGRSVSSSGFGADMKVTVSFNLVV